ncbi:Pro-kumamolisin, activation domain-containing protein [Biscogniauxia sp. FL1348]|nr:Pro-kumamolisin, activation domain-containing protein [Biscogniauxia sp. FL1348]
MFTMKFPGLLCLAGLVRIGAVANPLYRHGVDQIDPTISKRSIPETHTRHEKRMVEQERSWTKVERAKSEALLPMRIGLKQTNLQSGHDLLMDISNPESKNFGKHLSAEEVVDFFAPPLTSVAAIKEWLVNAGIPSSAISQSTNKQWIQFDAPVSQVEELLMADYHVWENRDTGVKNIACEEYHVPKDVKEHIDYITPGIKLMGYGSTQTPASMKKRETLDKISRLAQPIEPSELERLIHRRSRQQTSPSIRTTGVNNEGPLRFSEPIDSADVTSGNLTLAGGCDTYITPDCIRGQSRL